MSYLATLSAAHLRAVQSTLTVLGWPCTVDGRLGPQTQHAWAQWQAAIAAPRTLDVSPRAAFARALAPACAAQGLTLATQRAYILATVWWETAQTWCPVREAFWLSEAWRRQNLRYYPYYGRGYVQITWEVHYARYAQILGIDLLSQPDLAMEPAHALFILVHGFAHGTFTGKKISDYIHAEATDFHQCRRCINGLDKALVIAREAEAILADFPEETLA